ncbi:hypothetical protein [Candidimonas nitroreducens]|nr:hypothetical protein [Candidimonas nitroreducens]
MARWVVWLITAFAVVIWLAAMFKGKALPAVETSCFLAGVVWLFHSHRF